MVLYLKGASVASSQKFTQLPYCISSSSSGGIGKFDPSKDAGLEVNIEKTK